MSGGQRALVSGPARRRGVQVAKQQSSDEGRQPFRSSSISGLDLRRPRFTSVLVFGDEDQFAQTRMEDRCNETKHRGGTFQGDTV